MSQVLALASIGFLSSRSGSTQHPWRQPCRMAMRVEAVTAPCSPFGRRRRSIARPYEDKPAASLLGHMAGHRTPPIDTPARKEGARVSYTPKLAHISCNSLVEAKSLQAMRRKSGMPSERAALSDTPTRVSAAVRHTRELGQDLGAEGVLETAEARPAGGNAAPQYKPCIAGADFPCVACAHAPPSCFSVRLPAQSRAHAPPVCRE